jgi:hypothetical protein
MIYQPLEEAVRQIGFGALAVDGDMPKAPLGKLRWTKV